MRRLPVILSALLLGLLPGKEAVAEANCDLYQKTFFWDVQHSLWAEAEPGAGVVDKKTLYVLAAPWCPYCKALYHAYQEHRPDFSLRIVPIMAENQVNRDKAFDMVMSRAGLQRVYGENRSEVSASRDEYKFVVDAIMVAQEGFKDRVSSSTVAKTYVTPVSLAIEKENGTYFSFVGFDANDAANTLSQLEQRIVTYENIIPQNAFRDMIENPPATTPVEEQNKFANEEGALIYSLPSKQAAAGGCLAKGEGLAAVGTVEVGGETFWKVKSVFTPDGYVAYGYLADSEVH